MRDIGGTANQSADAFQTSDYAAFDQTAYLKKFPPETRWRRLAIAWAKLVVGSTILALIVCNAWLIYALREQELRKAAGDTANLARVAAGQMQLVLCEADQMLDAVVYAIRQQGTASAPKESLNSVVRHLIGAAKTTQAIYVHDAQGRLIATSTAASGAYNNADQPYFIAHQDNAREQSVVNPVIVGRTSGEWIVPITRRITDPQGAFAGVVVATVTVKRLREMLGSNDMGLNRFTVILADRILVRHPFNAADTGQPFASEWLHAQSATHLFKMFDVPAQWMRQEWITSSREIEGYPIRVLVEVKQSGVLERWRVSAFLQGSLIALLCAMLWTASRFVTRSLHRRISAEAGLRRTRDELAHANAQLARLAHYDALTDLPNRRYFNERFVGHFRHAQRQSRALAVVMVDVDEFKQYNDRYGHLAGDQCLARVAQAISASIARPEDFVARYGGEEMIMVLPETEYAGAVLVAEAARQAVVDQGMAHEASALGFVSISLGVAVGVPGPEASADELLQQADQALYRAKRAGRNKVTVCRMPSASNFAPAS
jgi:diguanylate cyclase (GGDEF)-like protein